MNSFDRASLIAEEAWKRLEPFIAGKCETGYILIDKGPLAVVMQKIIGDLMFSANNRFWTVEIKAEQAASNNFFLELFSNRNLEDELDHANLGLTVGWMFSLRSDLLFYYFLETDDLYIMKFFQLKQWAFGCGQRPGRIWSFPLKPQNKYVQKNDTWGAIVPIQILQSEIRVRRVSPREPLLL